jgi:CheY-like chemotaxis protein
MRLQQVLINLCGNAIKFTAKGEVVISASVLAQDAAGVTIEFAVRDTGIGIAAENQKRIFSGFTQAEASTTRRFGGTGLGVAISQRLVALMGGELRLESELGKGSCFQFCLTLPVTAAEGGDEPVAESIAPAMPGANPPALRALVVDDNPTAREVLARMGVSLGWTVDVVDSGEHALTLLQAQAGAGVVYQAVFVDWQMPGLDGWETSQRIRALGLAGKAPVVVMVTAHGREMYERRSEAERALLDGFLVKPVTASMLFDAIVDAGRDQLHSDRSRRPQPRRGAPTPPSGSWPQPSRCTAASASPGKATCTSS